MASRRALKVTALSIGIIALLGGGLLGFSIARWRTDVPDRTVLGRSTGSTAPPSRVLVVTRRISYGASSSTTVVADYVQRIVTRMNGHFFATIRCAGPRQTDAGYRGFICSISAPIVCGSTGLTKWQLKPASHACRRSCSWPHPVNATNNKSAPQGCLRIRRAI